MLIKNLRKSCKNIGTHSQRFCDERSPALAVARPENSGLFNEIAYDIHCIDWNVQILHSMKRMSQGKGYFFQSCTVYTTYYVLVMIKRNFQKFLVDIFIINLQKSLSDRHQ